MTKTIFKGVMIVAAFAMLLPSINPNTVEAKTKPHEVSFPKAEYRMAARGYSSHLDGLPNKKAHQTPIAVVMDNSAAGRNNQKGLKQASIVYESLAEGGVTRFLAIYDGSPGTTVGPIRSARPYSIDWAEEYRAAFAHVGGSPRALADLQRNTRLYNIDEQLDPYNTIFRKNNFQAPHNAFAKIKKVKNTLNRAGYNQPTTKPRFKFKDPAKNKGDVHKLVIDFSTREYKTRFLYNQKTNLYQRYHAGVKHKNIKAANIIVQYVNSSVIDSQGRIGIDTQGSGKSIVFRDGKAIVGHWRVVNGVTKFYNLKQKEVKMNRGQTWIEIVPNNVPIYTTNPI